MRALIGLVAAFMLALQPQAYAQQILSADEIAQQCTMDGAFGQTFGERRANGRTGSVNRPYGEFVRTVRPPTAFPPFSAFELNLTPRSRVIVQVTGIATFASGAEAETAYGELIAAYERNDAFPFQTEDLLMRPDAPEGITFKTEDFDAALSVTVARAGRTVYLVCANGPLFRQGIEEAMSLFN